MSPDTADRPDRPSPSETPEVDALVFDVFGTVVDWRGTVVREGRRLGRERGVDLDWEGLADRWRQEQREAVRRVAGGERDFRPLEAVNREALDRALDELGAGGLAPRDRERLSDVWRRLDPWPDAAEGLERLRRRHVVSTLSNGNVALLVAVAKHGGLPWDCILSAELARTYKPDPAVYRTAAELLALAPERILMVAAHPYDLGAAAGVGFRTAFVPRPLEGGPGRGPEDEPEPEAEFDLVVEDFLELAHRLGG